MSSDYDSGQIHAQQGGHSWDLQTGSSAWQGAMQVENQRFAQSVSESFAQQQVPSSDSSAPEYSSYSGGTSGTAFIAGNLGALAALESLIGFGYVVYALWNVHVVLALVCGIAVMYLILMAVSFGGWVSVCTTLLSMMAWGYAGAAITDHFWPTETIFQICAGLIGAGLACLDKSPYWLPWWRNL